MLKQGMVPGGFAALLIVGLVGCGGSEASLRIVEAESSPAAAEAAEMVPTTATPPVQWVKVQPNQYSASFEVEQSSDQTGFQETFWFGNGATTSLVDYLFVVDDSVSMENIIESFSRGFEKLSDSDAFPVNARIAVMNMTPANPRNLKRRHPVVPFRSGAEFSPGFLQLIDAESIKYYNAFAGDNGMEALRYDGCSAWFEPSATNAQGVSCLLAHTQLSLHRSVAEAGLVAFGQLVEKNRRGTLFREGAAVNVIMVSDTHDPGFVPSTTEGRREEMLQGLLDLRPDFAQLKAMVESRHLVSSFRVHAIAPRTDCSELWIDDLDPSYFEVSEASGGVVADICNVTDYSAVIREIASRGSEIQAGVFPLSLGKGRADVDQVFIGDREVAWTLSPSGRTVLVQDDLIHSEKDQLRIRYAVNNARRAQPAQVGDSLRSRQAR